MQAQLTPAAAFTLAMRWAPQITPKDPGSVFYEFVQGDARPLDERHRNKLKDACVRHVARFWGSTDPDCIRMGQELLALYRFFADCPLLDLRSAPAVTLQ